MAITTTFLEPGTDATQDLTFYSSAAGAVSSTNAQSHTGSYSLLLNTGAGPTQANVNTSAAIPNILSDTGSQISFYVMFSSLPAATTFVITLQTSAGLTVYSLEFTTTGIIRSAPAGVANINGTHTLSLMKWYRISISYYITSTTVFSFNVYVNGALDSTTNTGTLTRTGTNKLIFIASAAAGANYSMWLDDIYCATGGASASSQPDTGDIRVTAKRPFSNGTTNGFTTQIGAGGSGYGTGNAPQVNEQPLSTTDGWSIVGAGSAVTEEYNIEGLTVGDVNLNGATIVDYMGWIYSKSLAGETGQIIVNGNASNVSLTSTITLFAQAAGSTSYPAGTGSDIGEITSTTATTVSLYECGILVAFNPANSAVSRMQLMGVQ